MDVEFLTELVTNKRKYIENTMSIVDRDMNTVPFGFNYSQNHYWPNRTRRDIILKAGQLGFTSIIGADFLHDCITIPGTVSVIVAYEEFITQRILNRVKFFESTIPKEIKPELYHRSSYELTWPEINSTLYIGSARSYTFGRGERLTNFLGTEIAFWPDPKRIMDAVLQRANRVILESTPFGEGTYYHEVCQEAIGGNSIWTMHFYPWWFGEYNTLPPSSDLALPKDRITPLTYTTEELDLIEQVKEVYGMQLTEGNIRWRRQKINELKENFWFEHPEDIDSCFYTTSEMYFDKDTLDEMAKRCRPPLMQHNNADIWYLPEDGVLYHIGSDPTVGEVNNAAALVWCFKYDKPVHCATLYGRWEPYVFAEKLKALGYYYHTAMNAVEANNPGIAVLQAMQDYPNLYRRQDIITGIEKGQLGWLTTDSSKSYMMSVFHKYHMMVDGEPGIITHDIRLVREARNMRHYGLKVISTGTDDIFMAAAVGLVTKEAKPIKRGFVGATKGLTRRR